MVVGVKHNFHATTRGRLETRGARSPYPMEATSMQKSGMFVIPAGENPAPVTIENIGFAVQAIHLRCMTGQSINEGLAYQDNQNVVQCAFNHNIQSTPPACSYFNTYAMYSAEGYYAKCTTLRGGDNEQDVTFDCQPSVEDLYVMWYAHD